MLAVFGHEILERTAAKTSLRLSCIVPVNLQNSAESLLDSHF